MSIGPSSLEKWCVVVSALAPTLEMIPFSLAERELVSVATVSTLDGSVVPICNVRYLLLDQRSMYLIADIRIRRDGTVIRRVVVLDKTEIQSISGGKEDTV